MKQQDPEIINKRLISTPTSIDRQGNILTLIGPVLVGIFVLLSTVSALVSLSAACASIAVAEELSDSTPSISLVCQINVVAHLQILKKNPQKLILHLIDLETTSQLGRGTLVPIDYKRYSDFSLLKMNCSDDFKTPFSQLLLCTYVRTIFETNYSFPPTCIFHLQK